MNMVNNIDIALKNYKNWLFSDSAKEHFGFELSVINNQDYCGSLRSFDTRNNRAYSAVGTYYITEDFKRKTSDILFHTFSPSDVLKSLDEKLFNFLTFNLIKK